MTKTVTLFEDRSVRLDLTERERQELLQLEPIWGSQNFILRADNRLLLQRFVGFVATPNVQLQVLPKIYQENSSESAGTAEIYESIHLLFRLLHFSGFLKVNELPNPQQISRFGNDVLEIFISIFVKQFIMLFSRHMHRKYEQQEENTSFIRGKIQFQQTLLRNAGVRHKHSVVYEEFTEDTLLNQIFRTTMDALRRITKHPENKSKLSIAITYLEDVRPVALSSIVFEQVRFNRLNEMFHPLFEMAKMFYHNHQPGLSGGDANTFTFLVPLNELFEFSLYRLIQGACQGTPYDVRYQKPQRHLDATNSKFLLKPDITISHPVRNRPGVAEDGVFVIIDAKYKQPLSNGEIKLSQDDVYQMLAYAVRYRCDSLFLVYPKFKGSLNNAPTILHESLIQNENRTIRLQAIQVDMDFTDAEVVQNQLAGILLNGAIGTPIP